MNDCNIYIDLINKKLDDEATSEELEKLEEHLNDCEDCRILENDLREILDDIKNTDSLEDLPEGFAASLHEKLVVEVGDNKTRKVIPFLSNNKRLKDIFAVFALAASLLIIVNLTNGGFESPFDGGINKYSSTGTENTGEVSQAEESPSSSSRMKNMVKDAALVNDVKVIKNARLSLTAPDVEKALTKVESVIKNANGYIDNLNATSGNDQGSTMTSASIVARIPADFLDNAMKSISSSLHESSRDIQNQNVTMEYTNLKNQIKNLIVREDALRSLMKKAKTVDQILQVDKELSQVTTEIDNLNSSIKYYDTQISYSTLSINIDKANPDVSILDKIRNGIIDSLGMAAAIVMKVVYIVAYIAPYMLVGFAIYWLTIRILNKKN